MEPKNAFGIQKLTPHDGEQVMCTGVAFAFSGMGNYIKKADPNLIWIPKVWNLQHTEPSTHITTHTHHTHITTHTHHHPHTLAHTRSRHTQTHWPPPHTSTAPTPPPNVTNDRKPFCTHLLQLTATDQSLSFVTLVNWWSLEKIHQLTTT